MRVIRITPMIVVNMAIRVPHGPSGFGPIILRPGMVDLRAQTKSHQFIGFQRESQVGMIHW